MNKILILGAGESANGMEKPADCITIALNDSEKVVDWQPNYVFCIDEMRRFSPDRVQIIAQSKGKMIANDPSWSRVRQVDHLFSYVSGQPGIGRLGPRKPQKPVEISIISAFPAVVWAYHNLFADEFVLAGVDMVTHHLTQSNHKAFMIKEHFAQLKRALEHEGIKISLFQNVGILNGVI